MWLEGATCHFQTVAQKVERWLEEPRVAGSIPAGLTWELILSSRGFSVGGI